MSPNRSSTVRPHRLALAIAALLPFGSAFAQDTAPATPAATEKAATTLDAVQVTAQRRVENIQDVPVSISTISSEKLDVLASGGNDMRFLSARVPSLNIESSYGRAFPRFYIRGLGNTDFDLNASQPVSLIYDDVVQESPMLKGFPVFDLERIEVLRGPQGTLFGRNTPAGVVKFESAKPTAGIRRLRQGLLRHRQHVERGRRGRRRASPIAGRRAPRCCSSAATTRSPIPTRPVPIAVPKATTNPPRACSSCTKATGSKRLFNLHKRHLNGTARLFRANIIEPGTNNLVDGFDRDKMSTDGINFSELDTWGGSARLRWDLGDVTLYSITGYETAESLNRGDIDGGFGAAFLGPGNSGPGFIPFASESADGLPDHRQFTQEFRVESNEWGRFDWQAGLFYFDEDISIDSFNYDSLTPGNPRAGYAIQKQRNKAWAAFASGDFDVTDKFKLRGGLRYTQDKKDFSASVLEAAPFSAAPVGGPYTVQHRRRRRQLGPERRLCAQRGHQPVRARGQGLPRAVDPGPSAVRQRRGGGRQRRGFHRRFGRSDFLRSGRQGRPVGQARAPGFQRVPLRRQGPAAHRGRRRRQHGDPAQRRQDHRPGLRAGPGGVPDRQPAGHPGQQLQRHRDQGQRTSPCRVAAAAAR